MVDKKIYQTFKKGSRTYFLTSLFFPKNIKEDVFILYAFVRKADNFVDAIPQQKNEFKQFCRLYDKAISGKKSHDPIIDTFVDLVKRKKFKKEWVDAFLDAMNMDLYKSKYKTIKEVEQYMYGSAEVVGLMMAKILSLPAVSYTSARMLGRSMQYTNFLRDVREDLEMGRNYLPSGEQRGFTLSSYEKGKNSIDKEYRNFVAKQIQRAERYQLEAEKGFAFIPKHYLLPIKTASDLYNWTRDEIKKNPSIIYTKKIRPSHLRILMTIVKNWMTL